ncbi:hypothetical protein [Nocardia sp. NPDC004711]
MPLARVIGADPAQGLQPIRIGETVAVITDPGEQPGTGQRAEAGEAGEDLGVRVPFKSVLAWARSWAPALAASDFRVGQQYLRYLAGIR